MVIISVLKLWKRILPFTSGSEDSYTGRKSLENTVQDYYIGDALKCIVRYYDYITISKDRGEVIKLLSELQLLYKAVKDFYLHPGNEKLLTWDNAKGLINGFVEEINNQFIKEKHVICDASNNSPSTINVLVAFSLDDAILIKFTI